MAETRKAKADRLEKLQAKHDRNGHTPEAAAERANNAKQYDEDCLKQLDERAGVYI